MKFLFLSIALLASAARAEDPMAGMDMGMDAMKAEMGAQIYVHALLDQFEGRFGGKDGRFRWDGQGWIGGDHDKLWVKSEGFADGHGRVTDGDHELLYDRAVSALLEDLRARGLLDQTLVLSAGEFGRTPRLNRNAGRP